jgi:hypothetical protein
LLLYCALNEPFGHAAPLFWHLTHKLRAISGLGGGIDLAFGLIDTRLDRPITNTLARIADHKITRIDDLPPWRYAVAAA